MRWRTALRRLGRRAVHTLRVAPQLVRGVYYRVKFRFVRQRVEIGRTFQVAGRLDIRGPGRVMFGNGCKVVASYGPAVAWTHSPDAVIRLAAG